MKRSKKLIYTLLLAVASLQVIAAVSGASPLYAQLIAEQQQEPVDTTKRRKPRYSVKKTVAEHNENDLKQGTADLRDPENIEQTTEYDEKTGHYVIGSKLGDSYLNAPVLMTPEEYTTWNMKQSMNAYYRNKNAEEFEKAGKEKFDFTDMKFDLGPAEKIFGPGGVQIKTQGSAELKFGGKYKNTENPSLPERQRKTFGFDFDEKVNLNVTGKVGDKMNLNMNYNTDATFDFDTKKIKLAYEGKEDEIIKLLEAGNVSMPSNSSLIRGATSLFGVRADLQFGKLKLQTVVSQKESSSKSVSSKGGAQLTEFELSASNYDENRHFFLSHYFRDNYDKNMASLPNVLSGITITRVEIWVTNKSSNYDNPRNIIAFTDLAEPRKISNPMWAGTGTNNPYNNANSLYQSMVNQYDGARDIEQATNVLDGIPGFEGSVDYEKIENARLLNSSEYTLNKAVGYVSLKQTLQPDDVLAIAYEYTLNGTRYQVGEFAADVSDTQQTLYVKLLKNTSNRPGMGTWDLMMKNV
ncbi:MAG: cell surface protein SprA, partial [Bacteroidaceae bacterium]|nr:cell surface protein SprA [Bacteroidaceae bacterium]